MHLAQQTILWKTILGDRITWGLTDHPIKLERLVVHHINLIHGKELKAIQVENYRKTNLRDYSRL